MSFATRNPCSSHRSYRDQTTVDDAEMVDPPPELLGSTPSVGENEIRAGRPTEHWDGNLFRRFGFRLRIGLLRIIDADFEEHVSFPVILLEQVNVSVVDRQVTWHSLCRRFVSL